MSNAVTSIKRRSLPPKGVRSGSIDYGTRDRITGVGTSGFASDTLDVSAWTGSEFTQSENHPNWKRHKSGVFQGDVGGEFLNKKTYVEEVIPRYDFYSEKPSQDGQTISYVTYRGPVLPEAPGVHTFPSFINSSNATLDAWGSKAIAACKPTNSVADLSVFAGELMHEGVRELFHPSILEGIKDKTREARKVPADQYLQYQYGWLPVAHDVAKITTAVLDHHAILSQFERDSGKLVRRSHRFEPVITSSTDQVGTNVAVYTRPSHSAMYRTDLPSGKVLRTRTSLTERWFSGGFTYYTPQDYSLRGDVTRAVESCKRTLGLSFTPDVVWNLAPWSWAADWFFNIGDVLSNISDMAIYGLVLKYGYMMEHTKVSDRYTFSGDTRLIARNIRPGYFTLVSETKVRRKATPFGFGLTWNGFNAVQLAIAAALGISHS